MTEQGPTISREWLHDVREIYLSSAPGKVAELERAITGLELNPTSRTHQRRLRLLLHNLIGSGASYGFPAVSDTARGMSERLRQCREDDQPIDAAVLADLRGRLGHLRKIFAEARA
jgi:chemotaxis protein histidine kinase CheA